MKHRLLALLLAAVLTLTALPQPAEARDALKNTDPDQYYILLDLNNQIVTVYERDEAGEYTRIVRRMICTTGRTKTNPEDPEDVGTPTPRGIWKIGGRERFGKFASFAGEYARYWTQIVGGVYFHSIMFGKRDVNALKSNPYSKLGSNVSHGCVRLYIEDAKWLYYYACPGTVVNVSTSEPNNRELTRQLKSGIKFKTYNAMQKNFYDEEELPNYFAWTVKDGADLRTGNGSNDRRIAALDKGEEVEVLQLGDPWCKVRYDKKEGYIRTAYLTFEEGKMQSREDADIVKSTAYVYEAPEKSSKYLFKAPTYTTVTVLDDVSYGDYAQVTVWGVTCFIRKSSLTKGWGVLRDDERFFEGVAETFVSIDAA